jgi:hydroxyethylthiazole kinase-like uncharacterized protein yjeF
MTQDIPEFQITDQHRTGLQKSGGRHKYDYGHAIVVSGPAGSGGAARLAATGALRIGAGLVSVLCARDSQAEHAAQLNAVMVKTHDAGRDFADQLHALKPSAVCIGPNLGTGDDGRAKLHAVLLAGYPTCLDADAITLIAQQRDCALSAQTVMTPHEGELRRLIPDAFAQTTCRITLARQAAARTGATVLFKGADTIVAGPDGQCAAVRSGAFKHASWLATAGSGDVLAGFITGLMARGFDVFDAAALGAYLHLHCAQAIGPGLIAEDIPQALPRVLAQHMP